MEIVTPKRVRMALSEQWAERPEGEIELLNGAESTKDRMQKLESDAEPLENGAERLAARPERTDSKAELTDGSGAQRPKRFTFSAEPTLEEIRQRHAEFTDERDWNKYHQPRNLLLAMVGEVGEVAELFQWKGEVTEGLPDWTEKEREQLSYELSDVLIYLVELAEKCHVDLPQAVLRKMELNKQKYPASKVHGSAKKYTEYTD